MAGGFRCIGDGLDRWGVVRGFHKVSRKVICRVSVSDNRLVSEVQLTGSGHFPEKWKTMEAADGIYLRLASASAILAVREW